MLPYIVSWFTPSGFVLRTRILIRFATSGFALPFLVASIPSGFVLHTRILGRFAPSGFVICTSILGRFAPSGFMLCTHILSCFAPSSLFLRTHILICFAPSCFMLCTRILGGFASPCFVLWKDKCVLIACSQGLCARILLASLAYVLRFALTKIFMRHLHSNVYNIYQKIFIIFLCLGHSVGDTLHPF